MTSTQFSLAQQRLQARRQARLVQGDAPEPPQQAPGARHALSSIQDTGLRAWDHIRGREGTRPAFRVGQVDAELLDEELLELLKNQVADALKYFGGHVADDWQAEILLGLRAALFKLSMWDNDATYGAALQNLRFTDARKQSALNAKPTMWQKGVYGLVTVGGRYGWGKWEAWLAEREGGYEEPSRNVALLSRLSSILSTSHSVLGFASFLVFLVNGRYRTLLDRILRLRLTPPTSQVSREVSFEYLNRQLVWHAFTEFLLFVLPLVGIGRWRRWLARAWRKVKSVSRSAVGVEEQAGDDEDKRGELAFLPEPTCAICYQDQNPVPGTSSEADIVAASSSGGIIGSAATDITNPYEAIPCGDIYCFVCLAQRLEAEEGEGWTCLRCGEVVRECKPWNGDVVEVVHVDRPGSSGKSVGFAEEKDEEVDDKKEGTEAEDDGVMQTE
ncbi:MAG: peroxisome assembly protein (Peroxin-2) [Thelocarpon impressellum]|nr:MAG: peroxisome assembly protein (Peroxin-2) [Thelocarpon impressellum]